MSTSLEPKTEDCEVCIVGAGLAGMNALFSASRYLSRDQRVILVDRRPGVGGMWIDTYPYVRLHQPHEMFTAGNIPWSLGRERSYLATKDEVLEHFAHCRDVIGQQVRLDEFFGWTFESQSEDDSGVQVTCRSADGQKLLINAKRLIKADGFGVEPNNPLPLSSSQVHSVSPDYCDVRAAEIASSDAPVWIIGGGKTAMDTAHILITQNPGREINLMAGSGTFFTSRDKFFPLGLKRWFGGTMVTDLGHEVTKRFDGRNEEDMWEWQSANYGTAVTPQTGNFYLGVLSEAEKSTISAGLNHVVMDHLLDVVDSDRGPELVLRSGESTAVPAGSWVVNCTGYLNYREQPYEPYISAHGKVLSIKVRSATLHLSSYMGYFMPHLLFLDKLKEVPLYEIDAQELRAKARKAFPYVLLTLAQYNLSLIADQVPVRVFQDCGLDFDRWYPLPRRLLANARFATTHRRSREPQRRCLDVARERFDIRCGPLQSVTL